MSISPKDIITFLFQYATRIVIAIIIWLAGRLLIRFVLGLSDKRMITRKIDTTVIRYTRSAINVLLNVLLLVGILSYFGIETTGVAALLAGAGIAVGAAVGGLLTHFTAGIFMLWLRPFKVGDHVTAGSVTGTVIELGMLYTKVNTPDNVLTMVGNNTIFTGVIQNYSANPYRRVQLSVQLAHDADHQRAIQLLEQQAGQIHNVRSDPAPHASITSLGPGGPSITLSLYCINDHYFQVTYDGYRMIRETFAQESVPIT